MACYAAGEGLLRPHIPAVSPGLWKPHIYFNGHHSPLLVSSVSLTICALISVLLFKYYSSLLRNIFVTTQNLNPVSSLMCHSQIFLFIHSVRRVSSKLSWISYNNNFLSGRVFCYHVQIVTYLAHFLWENARRPTPTSSNQAQRSKASKEDQISLAHSLFLSASWYTLQQFSAD
jgi:hypothetical protein